MRKPQTDLEGALWNIFFETPDTAKVNLKVSEDGISPGQACVFYKKNEFGYKVLGGGWIVN